MQSPSAFIFGALAFSSLVLAPAFAEEPAAKPDDNSVVIEGEASYYGGQFHGKKTANGEIFDQNKMTAASK
ncbi:MAG TPA: septal ring lytic transglycosylase RlpA family protein, partial [Skermanella sp.]|nr:septal ring lytic transglycosylase RlpA family protein [Skermanella sp.]